MKAGYLSLTDLLLTVASLISSGFPSSTSIVELSQVPSDINFIADTALYVNVHYTFFLITVTVKYVNAKPK